MLLLLTDNRYYIDFSSVVHQVVLFAELSGTEEDCAATANEELVVVCWFVLGN